MGDDPDRVTPGVDWESWLRRWERMQARHLHDRAGRIEVLAEACGLAPGQPSVRIVELGCGPGGILGALAERHPGARLVGLDHDPVLLAIARATAGRRPDPALVDVDLRRPDWTDRLRGAAGIADGDGFGAVVSSTALHWLEPDQLGQVYAGAYRLLRPAGILLNADRLAFGEARLDALAERMRQTQEAEPSRAEDWTTWWAGIAAEPALAALHAERERRFPPTSHAHGHSCTEDDHLRLLRAAGFSRVAKLWAWYDSAVLCALR